MDASDATVLTSDDADPCPALRIVVADQQSTLPIDQSQVEAAVRFVLQDSVYRAAMVSVAVVGDSTIHRLNRQYLHHDYPTDVLSFVLEAIGPHLQGELIISADTAIKNAAEYGWSASEELLLYVVHGALHLVGYRDKLQAEQVKMRAAEAHYLRKLGIELPVDDNRWQRNDFDVARTGEVRAS